MLPPAGAFLAAPTGGGGFTLTSTQFETPIGKFQREFCMQVLPPTSGPLSAPTEGGGLTLTGLQQVPPDTLLAPAPLPSLETSAPLLDTPAPLLDTPAPLPLPLPESPAPLPLPESPASLPLPAELSPFPATTAVASPGSGDMSGECCRSAVAIMVAAPHLCGGDVQWLLGFK